MGLSRKLIVTFFVKRWARHIVRIQEMEVIVAIIIVQKLPRYENTKKFSEAVCHSNSHKYSLISYSTSFSPFVHHHSPLSVSIACQTKVSK